MAKQTNTLNQLGFDALLADADEINRRAVFEREFGHLPATFEEAVPYLRDLIDRHHAAMLAADVEEVMRLREEASRLALRLNNGDPGILAGPDAPGCRLAGLTAAAEGTIPLWGQAGSFTHSVDGIRVHIETDGLYDIGMSVMFYPGFSAHAVNPDRPFISETGYRSFYGLHAEPVTDMTFDAFVTEVIRSHIRHQLKGKLVAIVDRYRDA